MVAENIALNVSGLPAGEQALRGMTVTILCGVSGLSVIPLRCDAKGNLMTSGAF